MRYELSRSAGQSWSSPLSALTTATVARFTHHSPLTTQAVSPLCHSPVLTIHSVLIHHLHSVTCTIQSAVNGLSAIRDMMSFRSAVGTQAQIVALAVYQLKSGGYEELHFGAIASALGVTRANIHHHFSSKENLAQVALEEFIEDRLCRLQAMIDRYPSDFPSALDSIGEYLQKLYSDHPGEGLCACSALLLNNTSRTPVTQRSIRRLLQGIECPVPGCNRAKPEGRNRRGIGRRGGFGLGVCSINDGNRGSERFPRSS